MMHSLKTARRPLAVTREAWESLPIPPRVRRMYEQTGNVTVVETGELKT